MIAIRNGATPDAPQLTRIFLGARRASMGYLPPLHTDAETARWMERMVLPNARVLVADLDGRIAGFAAIRPGTLDHLYVAPEFQSRGIGGALLQAAKASGSSLRLFVFEQNAGAQRFYRRHGFAVVERRGGEENEERLPDLVMEWHRSEPHPAGDGRSGAKQSGPHWVD